MKLPTSTQPQVDPTLTIYGSKKVIPLDSANQPEVIPNKVYGAKALPTIRVKPKGSDKEVLINTEDFDPDHHVRL